jgi:hypothetical protein
VIRTLHFPIGVTELQSCYRCTLRDETSHPAEGASGRALAAADKGTLSFWRKTMGKFQGTRHGERGEHGRVDIGLIRAPQALAYRGENVTDFGKVRDKTAVDWCGDW